MKKNLKTFCPLPWMHISASPSGDGRICCNGSEYFKDKTQKWQYADGLNSYFNSEEYKKVRLQMLSGVKPSHCSLCFKQEDHGIYSSRKTFIDTYRPHINYLINNTRTDGSVDLSSNKILFIDMALGNKCNIKCRMCSPWLSFPIASDWKKMGKKFDYNGVKEIFQNKWYTSPQCFNLIKESISSVRTIFFTGGEPTIIKEHFQILKMIIEENHADHITIRYNSNQTIISKELIDIWKKFEKIEFNCSVEGHGALNDYIRYPTRWKKLEKNIYYLDEIASGKEINLKIEIHTTFQAYNVPKIPDLLDYLRYANFKNVHRFPRFIWVESPKWLSPNIFPSNFKEKMALNILKKIDQHEEFFLAYNESHAHWNYKRIGILRNFVEMMKSDPSSKEQLDNFIKETRNYDNLHNQSITKVLPEVATFFNK